MLVERDMKLDGRTLEHTTLEQIRRMAVQRVREGEKPADVIASLNPLPRCWNACGRR